MNLPKILPAIEKKAVPLTMALDNGLAQVGQGAKNFAKGFMDPNTYSDPNTTDPNSAEYQGALVGNYPGGSEVSGGVHLGEAGVQNAGHLLPAIGAAATTGIKTAKKATNVIDKVVSPDIAKSLQGAEHTANIRDALQRQGVTDWNNIGQAASDIYKKKILPTLSAAPKLLPLDTVQNGPTGIVDSIVSEMRKLKPGLDPAEAKKAAHGVISDLYTVGRNAAPGTLVPTHLDTPSIFNIRQDLNGTQAVKNFFAGHPPSDITDLATIAARNALSKVIGIAHPEIAQATHDYGLLSDAVPSIYKETVQAAKDAANKPSFGDKYIPNSVLGTDVKPIYNAVHDVVTNPIGQKAALLAAGGAGALALPTIKGYLDNSANSNAQQNGSQVSPHGQSISQQYTNSKPDPDGGLHLPMETTPNPNSPYITNQQFNDMTKGMSTNSTEYKRLYNQWNMSQDQAKAKFQNNTIMRFMDQADKYFNDGSLLENEIGSINPGVWNDISKSKGIQGYLSTPNRPFAGQVADIAIQNDHFKSAFRDAVGKDPSSDLDLSVAQSPEQFREILSKQQKFFSDTWKLYRDPYLAVTSPSGAQTPQGGAQPIRAVTSGVSGGDAPTGGNAPDLSQQLPPIR